MARRPTRTPGPAPAPIRGPVVGVILLAAFALEIVALVFIALGVAHASQGRARWVLAAAAVGLTAIVWGTFVAPRAPRRLRDPRRLIVELLVYFCGTAGLVAVTGSSTAWLGIALAAVVALLARMTGADA